MDLFKVLKSEVFAGQAVTILDRAGASGLDMEVITGLDGVLAQWRADRAKERQNRG